MILTHQKWSVVFDEDTAMIRRISFGGVEVLRGVYAAVRDRNWATIAPLITDLTTTRADPDDHTGHNDSLQIRFAARCTRAEIDFDWRGRITLGPTSLAYDFHGIARRSFLKNRIGFCVLHPCEAAGQWCRIEHTDGRAIETRFPLDIAPHQPFKAVRSITHRPAEAMSVSVTLIGDTFETEDQRNWTDASFKTYCTPLDEPFPVEVAAGTQIDQRVVIDVEARHDVTVLDGAAGDVILQTTHPPETLALPRIGLCLGDDASPSPLAVELLRKLRIDHLRVELGPPGDWSAECRRASMMAGALGAALEIAITLDDLPHSQLAARLGEALLPGVISAPVCRWMIHADRRKPAPAEAVVALASALQAAGISSPIGTGTQANFAELNRNRPAPGVGDFLTLTINPQVHAFDDASLVETLAVAQEVVRTARSFAAGRAVVVSPITLKPRFNAVATAGAAQADDQLPSNVDPRQRSAFAAAWALGSLRHLAQARVASTTWFATGWRGLIEQSATRPPVLQAAFGSSPGEVFPLYRLFESLAPFVGGQVTFIDSSDPLAAEAMLLSQGDRLRLLVAVFQDRPIHLTVAFPIGPSSPAEGFRCIAGVGTASPLGAADAASEPATGDVSPRAGVARRYVLRASQPAVFCIDGQVHS